MSRVARLKHDAVASAPPFKVETRSAPASIGRVLEEGRALPHAGLSAASGRGTLPRAPLSSATKPDATREGCAPSSTSSGKRTRVSRHAEGVSRREPRRAEMRAVVCRSQRSSAAREPRLDDSPRVFGSTSTYRCCALISA